MGLLNRAVTLLKVATLRPLNSPVILLRVGPTLPLPTEAAMIRDTVRTNPALTAAKVILPKAAKVVILPNRVAILLNRAVTAPLMALILPNPAMHKAAILLNKVVIPLNRAVILPKVATL